MKLQLKSDEINQNPILKKFLEDPESISSISDLDTILDTDYRYSLKDTEYSHLNLVQLLCASNKLPQLQYIESIYPQKLKDMIHDKFHGALAFHLAAKGGHLEILKYIKQQMPHHIHQIMIAASGYEGYREAARYGHLEVMKYMENESPENIQNMVASRDFLPFLYAAEGGQLGVMKHLEQKIPNQLQDMIKIKNFEAFRNAGKGRSLKVFKYLEQKSPHSLQEMIEAKNFEVFRNAARNGHLNVLKYLAYKSPHNLQRMIAANDFEVFIQAALGGHLDVFEYLERKSPHNLQRMIAARYFGAFRAAAFGGHLNVLKYLEDKSPDNLQKMIASNDFEAFRLAASGGHLNVLEYLLYKSPYNNIQTMIARYSYEAFCKAVENGHLNILKYLADNFPYDLQRMIAAQSYQAFFRAAANRKIHVIHYLAKTVDSNNYIALETMLKICLDKGYEQAAAILLNKLPNEYELDLTSHHLGISIDTLKKALTIGGCPLNLKVKGTKALDGALSALKERYQIRTYARLLSLGARDKDNALHSIPRDILVKISEHTGDQEKLDKGTAHDIANAYCQKEQAAAQEFKDLGPRFFSTKPHGSSAQKQEIEFYNDLIM